MLQNKLGWQTIVSFLLFLLFTIFWIVIQVFFVKNGDITQIFTASYGLMALWGAICGMVIANKWGGFKSVVGKAILMFSFGLFAQELGQIVYSYYFYVAHAATPPYPSFGDLGYFGSIPLYCYGILLLGKASGAQLRLKSIRHTLFAIIITFAVLILGYMLFLQNYIFDWKNPVKIFLDFGYPFGEAIYISLAASVFMLSSGILGGIMKNRILLILFALCIQFLADYTFLYQSNNGSWTAGGINDFIYLVSYFVMTIGLLQFDSVLKKFRRESQKE